MKAIDMRINLIILLLIISFFALVQDTSAALEKYTANPRYFSDNGKPIFLVGDYPRIATFMGEPFENNKKLDWKKFLDCISNEGINLVRQTFTMGGQQILNPSVMVPWKRTGPGMALDGRPKYNLDLFDPQLFNHFLEIARYAQSKGIYLQLTIMDAWNIKANKLDTGWGWRYHAFNGENNIQGLDASSGSNGSYGFTNLKNQRLLQYQKALIRKVADTFKNEPNVMFEIANENFYNKKWEILLADYLKDYERKMGYTLHLVMPKDLPNHGFDKIQTFNSKLLHKAMLKQYNLRQPLISDSDGIGNPPREILRQWAWTAFISGGSVSYLDQGWISMNGILDNEGTVSKSSRQDIGYMRRFAQRIKFWQMNPLDDVTAGETLAFGTDGEEYVIYSPSGSSFPIKIPEGTIYRARWYDPRTGDYIKLPDITAGDTNNIRKIDSSDWVLWLVKIK